MVRFPHHLDRCFVTDGTGAGELMSVILAPSSSPNGRTEDRETTDLFEEKIIS